MKSRVYQIGSLILHTGPEPEIYENAQRVQPSELGIRSTDALILQHMAMGSCENKDRLYTVAELWKAGWSEMDRAGKTPTQETNSVQGAMSRLRGCFPDTFPNKADGGWKLIKRVVDHTPVDSPLLVGQRIFIGCVITSLCVVVVDTPTRAILSGLKVTLVQTTKRPGFIEAVIGLFQGVCGSVLYSVPIAFGLFYLWFMVFDHEPWKGKYPRIYASSIGAFMGAFGGGIISAILVWAQHPETLYEAGWSITKPILTADPHTNVWIAAREAWFVTHVAWSMPWFGVWAGAAVSLSVMRVFNGTEWSDFLYNNTAITDPKIGIQILFSLLKTAAISTLRFVFPALLVAAGLFCLLPHDPISRVRIFGESMVVAMGGLGFICGFLASLYVLTKGADIAGDRKCSMQPAVPDNFTP